MVASSVQWVASMLVWLVVNGLSHHGTACHLVQCVNTPFNRRVASNSTCQLPQAGWTVLLASVATWLVVEACNKDLCAIYDCS